MATGWEVKAFDLEQVDDRLLVDLKPLFDAAYHSSSMFDGLRKDMMLHPEPFKLFVAFDGERAVGARAIELREDMHQQYADLDYLGHDPLWGKRFTVLPEYRGLGIGQEILRQSNDYCFNQLGAFAIFGSSAEIGALAMYGRVGALYLRSSICNYSHKNTAEQQLFFFRQMIADKKFRAYRLPAQSSKDIRFVYAADKATREFFQQHGYLTYQQLLEA